MAAQKAPWTLWLVGMTVHSTMPTAMSLKTDSAPAVPEATQRAAVQTTSVALLPDTGVYMGKDGAFVTWPVGVASEAGSDSQVWYMRKCSGTGASECVGISNNWLSTNSALLSGDVVAWHNKQSNQVYDCAWGDCSHQPYPPPGGHWGTPYRIIKLSGGSAVSDGTPIYLGDDVYYYGMQNSVFSSSHIIGCSSSGCTGSDASSSSNAISGNTFRLCSSYACTDTPSDGAAAGGAAAVGDPHVQNVHGERFDLMKPGKHILINIPRGKRAEEALLRVQADARRIGKSCAEMYFIDINITGQWVEAKLAGGLRFQAPGVADESPNWMTFGKVQVKVAHGHTRQGIQYLNFYVKHLGHAGFAVGGLLGEDDHQDVMIPPASCAHQALKLNIEPVEVGGKGPSVSSVAVADFA